MKKKKYSKRNRRYCLSRQSHTQNRVINTITIAQEPLTAIVYQSELDYISRCILDYPQIETGGQLFGFYSILERLFGR